MNAMYSNYFKALRFSTALVAILYSFMAFANAPAITSVAGTMKDGQTVTLTGSNFTSKANVKPLLFWSAESGLNPSPLGRKTAWDGDYFGGAIVDKALAGVVVAPGSTKVLRHDYETSEGAALSRVHFDSDQLFVWRKRYDDFDRSKDFAIRTRYAGLVSKDGGITKKVAVGMYMATPDRKLWGKVIKVVPNSDGVTGTVFYSNQEGNLTNYPATHAVANGTRLDFYASDKTPVVQTNQPILAANLTEGGGIFQTFNHKIFRLWGEYGRYGNNTYISLDKDGAIVSEYTQVGTFWMSLWDNTILSASKRWVVEEFQYQAGHVDQIDGILLYWQDRVLGWKEDHKFRFTKTQSGSSDPTALSHRYSDVYQTQASNGTQPLSFEYFDSLYIDDSWHRVMVCNEPTWSTCKQPEIAIPSAWDTGEIKVSLRLGALKGAPIFYLYVVNGLGEVNERGYPSCPMCPLPPKTLISTQ